MWSFPAWSRRVLGLVVLSVVVGTTGVAVAVGGAPAVPQLSTAVTPPSDCAFCWD